ncbi:hypothetical protein BST11_25880 [Mycobacterium alsense]|uniref:Uncharacterized protein n=1 Tax=Mycobacterium alsense TaxID=324058 RepID=A0ABX3R1L2_9MYCO|nr:hypothetical protein BST11_25880 [Mycobacterium alsense]
MLKDGILLAAFDAPRPTADVDAWARNFANDEATVVVRIIAIAEQPVSLSLDPPTSLGESL